MAIDLAENGTPPESISEDDFGKFLCLGDLPAVDLCIRTSGEQRISNFLLWQMAYAELVFVDALWPEFKHQKMVDTLAQFGQRQRRFGQTGAQSIE
jgi:undecaprenyl diphosphate synthase